MPNDDLGQFPTPSNTSPAPQPEPQTTANEDTSLLEDINTPAANQISNEPFTTPPDTSIKQEDISAPPAFEETPEVLPSTVTPPSPEPITETAPAPAPAVLPSAPKGNSAFGSLIGIILLLIAGGALAIAVFLFSQTKQLRQQLQEVTQTLKQQQTTITPTPTPTIIEFPTPTPTPEATISAAPTPTPTATLSAEKVLPLANADDALKIAIKHLPNAQLILIKTENATAPALAATKYFFRQDLTTKKYFYVLIADKKDPEIVDKAIYVTPDNNIPSLNDAVLGNTLGIDLNEALKIANTACASNLCSTATVKAQYIKSGENNIWQLSFDPIDASKSTLIIQINAVTKEVLFKSAGF